MAEMTEKKGESPIIQVKNLYKVYQVGETKVFALNGVSFSLNKDSEIARGGPLRIGKIHPAQYDGRSGETVEGRDHHSRHPY